MHKIVPDELIKGLKLIIIFTFLGISLLFGAIKYPYPLEIVVMVVSVGFLVWTRKWFE